MVAIWLVSAALEGYLYRVGAINVLMRFVVLIAAAALIYPERMSDLLGFALVIGIYVLDATLGGRLGSKQAQRVAEEKSERQAAEDQAETPRPSI